MVRLFYFLLLSMGTLPCQAGFRFVTEFSKLKFFQGETVTCQFVLYGTETQIEAEVAKFPEFRGYWSENSALRQGAVLLGPDPKDPTLRRLVIGSYTLTPMVGMERPTIEPMRLVLRSLSMAGEASTTLVSELEPLTILPLPQPPAGENFFGAVGQFQLRAEAAHVRYLRGEPVSLRLLLLGTGNFPELNTLPISFPSEVKQISQRSSLIGSGAFQTKTFEILLTVDSDQTLELPPIRFAFFNPQTSKYETVTSTALLLEPLPTPVAPTDEPQLALGPVQTQWHLNRPTLQSPFFWATQVCLAIFWLYFAIRRLLSARAERKQRDPRTHLRRRWATLLDSPSENEHTQLRDADRLVFDTIGFLCGKSFTTRKQAVEAAKHQWGAETGRRVHELFGYSDRYYSGVGANLPTNLIDELRTLRADLKV